VFDIRQKNEIGVRSVTPTGEVVAVPVGIRGTLVNAPFGGTKRTLFKGSTNVQSDRGAGAGDAYCIQQT